MLTFIFAGVVVVSLTGCVAAVSAGAGVGGYKYYTGRLKVEYASDYNRVWKASRKALQDLDISIISTQKDKISGEIKGERQNGEKVRIHLKNKSGGVTSVKIRVGLIGDKDASLLIKEKIDKRL